MDLLNRQIGVVNFDVLIPQFTQIALSSRVFTHGFAHCPMLQYDLLNQALNSKINSSSIPNPTFLPSHINEMVQEGYKLFKSGKFAETKTKFQQILSTIPFIGESQVKPEELKQLKQIITISREYIRSCLLELKRKEEESPSKKLEYVSYMTQCDLLPNHMLLALNLAMTFSFKMKNFINSADFSRRILENSEIDSQANVSLKDKAIKVLQQSELQARNEMEINYDISNPKSICMKSLTPIPSAPIKCPYCSTLYMQEFKGQICEVCNLSKIGEQTIGLVLN